MKQGLPKVFVCVLMVLGGLSFCASSASAKLSGPITCRGNQDLTLNGYRIRAKHTGIRVLGNCTLNLRNSSITAGRLGILVSGNGTINIKNSRVFGGSLAVLVKKSGTVNATRSVFRGRRAAVWVVGNGDFNNNGKNILSGGTKKGKFSFSTRHRAMPTAPPRKRLRFPRRAPRNNIRRRVRFRRSGPIRCVGVQRITLRNRRIVTRGTAVHLLGACTITLINCRIAGKVGIKVTGTGRVRLIGSVVRGRRAAVSITGVGKVFARNTKFYGKFLRTGVGRFIEQGRNLFR